MTDTTLPDIENARVVVVDDEENNVLLVERALRRAGWGNVHGFTDPEAAISSALDDGADLVVVDLHMPVVDGWELMRRLSEGFGDEFVPFLVLTADATGAAWDRSFAAGAADFLTKPVNVSELRARAARLLSVRELHDELSGSVDTEADETYLAGLAEKADEMLGRPVGRAQRIGSVMRRVALECGARVEEADAWAEASRFMDVGVLGVPEERLERDLREGELHTKGGAFLLSDADARFAAIAAVLALSHHERFDGSGKPLGLSGTSIPLSARIAAAAEVFEDAGGEGDVDVALSAVRDCAGSALDPEVVAALSRAVGA